MGTRLTYGRGSSLSEVSVFPVSSTVSLHVSGGGQSLNDIAVFVGTSFPIKQRQELSVRNQLQQCHGSCLLFSIAV